MELNCSKCPVTGKLLYTESSDVQRSLTRAELDNLLVHAEENIVAAKERKEKLLVLDEEMTNLGAEGKVEERSTPVRLRFGQSN